MSTIHRLIDDSNHVLTQKPGRSPFAILCVGLALSGCAESGNDDAIGPPVPVAESSPIEETSPSSSKGDGKTTHRHYEGIGFAIPDSWQEIPDAKMVDSKYIIPTEHGDHSDVDGRRR